MVTIIGTKMTTKNIIKNIGTRRNGPPIIRLSILNQISFPLLCFLLSETPLFSLTRISEKMTSEIFSWLIRRQKFLG